MSRIVLALLLAAHMAAAFRDTSPPPDDWAQAVRFRYNPGCTQRLQMLSLRVGNGVACILNEDFDARMWIHAYNAIFAMGGYDFTIKSLAGCINVHDNLSPFDTIDKTYVMFPFDTQYMIGFGTNNKPASCFSDIAIQQGSGGCVQDLEPSALLFWSKMKDNSDKTLRYLQEHNCSTHEKQRDSQVCHNELQLANRFHATSKEYDFGLFLYTEMMQMEFNFVNYMFSGIPLNNEVDGFVYSLAAPYRKMYQNTRMEVQSYISGDYDTLVHGDITSFGTDFIEKFPNWGKTGVPDLRRAGLADEPGLYNRAGVNRVWKWRQVELLHGDFNKGERNSLDLFYTGYTGCSSGPGRDLQTAPFTLLSFSGSTVQGIYKSVDGTERSSEKDTLCEFVCRLPGNANSAHARVNGLPKSSQLASLYGMSPFAQLHVDADDGHLHVGFSQDASVFESYTTMPLDTKTAPSRFLWNIAKSIAPAENPAELFWPSVKQHSPLMGYNRDVVFFTKRVVCDVTGTFFISPAGDAHFYAEDGVFYKEFSYRLTWASSSLVTYYQTAHNCNLLQRGKSIHFVQPYSVLSPMALLFAGDASVRSKVPLDQAFFQQCTWSAAALDAPASGPCEKTVTGSSHFSKECAAQGHAHFPVYHADAAAGWECYSSFTQQVTETQLQACPRNDLDKCATLKEYRTFSYAPAAYPYYDCQIDLANTAICHERGILLENWRCAGHVGPLCRCNPGYHGRQCQYVGAQWDISYLTEGAGLWNFERNEYETDPLMYDYADNALLVGGVPLRLDAADCFVENKNVSIAIARNQIWEITAILTSSTTTTTPIVGPCPACDLYYDTPELVDVFTTTFCQPDNSVTLILTFGTETECQECADSGGPFVKCETILVITTGPQIPDKFDCANFNHRIYTTVRLDSYFDATDFLHMISDDCSVVQWITFRVVNEEMMELKDECTADTMGDRAVQVKTFQVNDWSRVCLSHNVNCDECGNLYDNPEMHQAVVDQFCLDDGKVYAGFYFTSEAVCTECQEGNAAYAKCDHVQRVSILPKTLEPFEACSGTDHSFMVSVYMHEQYVGPGDITIHLTTCDTIRPYFTHFINNDEKSPTCAEDTDYFIQTFNVADWNQLCSHAEPPPKLEFSYDAAETIRLVLHAPDTELTCDSVPPRVGVVHVERLPPLVPLPPPPTPPPQRTTVAFTTTTSTIISAGYEDLLAANSAATLTSFQAQFCQPDGSVFLQYQFEDARKTECNACAAANGNLHTCRGRKFVSVWHKGSEGTQDCDGQPRIVYSGPQFLGNFFGENALLRLTLVDCEAKLLRSDGFHNILDTPDGAHETCGYDDPLESITQTFSVSDWSRICQETTSTTSTSTTLVPRRIVAADEAPECGQVLLPLFLTAGVVLALIFFVSLWRKRQRSNALLAFFICTTLGMVSAWAGVRSCPPRHDAFLQTVAPRGLWVRTDRVPAFQFRAGRRLGWIDMKRLHNMEDAARVYRHQRIPYPGLALARTPLAREEPVYRKQQFHNMPYLGSHSAPVMENFCSKNTAILTGGLHTATPFRSGYTAGSDAVCRSHNDWMGFYCATNSSLFINHCFRATHQMVDVMESPLPEGVTISIV